MRRLSTAWLLSLLLVLAQQGAVLHELGHLSHGAGAGTPELRADAQIVEGACPTCAAFAQVTSPASGAVNTLAACAAVYLPVPAPPCAFVGADAPTPRNRGPPQA